MTPSKQYMPRTYAEIDAYLGSRRARTIAHNTTAERADEHIIVRLHGNEIARLCPRSVSVSDAGWRTPTTKDRLNRILAPYGARIAQCDWTWSLRRGERTEPWTGSATVE